jgi:hypothetical protein
MRGGMCVRACVCVCVCVCVYIYIYIYICSIDQAVHISRVLSKQSGICSAHACGPSGPRIHDACTHYTLNPPPLAYSDLQRPHLTRGHSHRHLEARLQGIAAHIQVFQLDGSFPHRQLQLRLLQVDPLIQVASQQALDETLEHLSPTQTTAMQCSQFNARYHATGACVCARHDDAERISGLFRSLVRLFMLQQPHPCAHIFLTYTIARHE